MTKLSQAALEARRAYHRKWQKENPEKVKAQHDRYWEKIAAKAAAAEKTAAEVADAEP